MNDLFDALFMRVDFVIAFVAAQANRPSENHGFHGILQLEKHICLRAAAGSALQLFRELIHIDITKGQLVAVPAILCRWLFAVFYFFQQRRYFFGSCASQRSNVFFGGFDLTGEKAVFCSRQHIFRRVNGLGIGLGADDCVLANVILFGDPLTGLFLFW